MTTTSDLALALTQAMDSGQRAAVAIVTQTDGSVYRRAGARSVVLEDGRILGVISGGCAEQDLLEHAKETWETGKPKQIAYDFRSPDDALWGMGAGCNGALHIALFPFGSGGVNQGLTDRLHADMARRANSQVAYPMVTVLDTTDTARYPLGPLSDDEVTHVLAEGPIQSSMAPQVLETAIDGVNVTLFVEMVQPRPHLVVIGAGDDAVPLVAYAKAADYHVTVVDHRGLMNNSARFPHADVHQVIRRTEYASLQFHESTFVVVMTHNYELDETVIAGLATQRFAYVGVLGPRHRFERMITDITKDGPPFAEATLAMFHSPIGLDIGADTPEEIAISILAEVTAARRSRSGGALRDIKGPIHTTEGTK